MFVPQLGERAVWGRWGWRAGCGERGVESGYGGAVGRRVWRGIRESIVGGWGSWQVRCGGSWWGVLYAACGDLPARSGPLVDGSTSMCDIKAWW